MGKLDSIYCLFHDTVGPIYVLAIFRTPGSPHLRILGPATNSLTYTCRWPTDFMPPFSLVSTYKTNILDITRTVEAGRKHHRRSHRPHHRHNRRRRHHHHRRRRRRLHNHQRALRHNARFVSQELVLERRQSYGLQVDVERLRCAGSPQQPRRLMTEAAAVYQ